MVVTNLLSSQDYFPAAGVEEAGQSLRFVAEAGQYSDHVMTAVERAEYYRRVTKDLSLENFKKVKMHYEYLQDPREKALSRRDAYTFVVAEVIWIFIAIASVATQLRGKF